MTDQKLDKIKKLLIPILELLNCELVEKPAISPEPPRDNLSPADCPQTEKVGTFCPGDWEKNISWMRTNQPPLDYNKFDVPKTLEDARKFFTGGFVLRSCLEIAIEKIMLSRENHNFWFASKRHYVHVSHGEWKQILAKTFYIELKAKIWRFYWKSLTAYFSRKGCPETILIDLGGAMKFVKLQLTDTLLRIMLEKHKPLLRAAFNNRARSQVKVI